MCQRTESIHDQCVSQCLSGVPFVMYARTHVVATSQLTRHCNAHGTSEEAKAALPACTLIASVPFSVATGLTSHTRDDLPLCLGKRERERVCGGGGGGR